MASQDSKKPLKTPDVVELDDVLGKLGAFGRHQLLTMGMLALVYATNSMYNVNYVFAVEDVNYRCKIPECESATTAYNVPWLDLSDDDRVRQCYRHPPTDGGCLALNTSVMEGCTEWVYEVPNSFVADDVNIGDEVLELNTALCLRTNETKRLSQIYIIKEYQIFHMEYKPINIFNLACQEWKVTLVGTTHLFGSLVGQLVQGQISDRYGRKTAAVLAGSAGAILGLGKSCASSYWLFVALEGLEAAIGDALSPMFMLSIEIVEKKRAVLYQMILLNFYTAGQIAMPWIARASPHWRIFLRLLYAPALLVLSYALFLDESVRWLLSKGQKRRAVKLIRKIAARNKVHIDDETLEKLNYTENTDEVSDKKLLLQTFKSRVMVQRFLICVVWWFTITLINYGMMISSVLIGGDKYLSFALLVMMDIPANLLYWLALDKCARKIPLIASFVIGGLFCVTQPFLPKEYAWLGLVLLMAFELLATFSYNIVYIFTSELFPTYTRHSLHALCAAAGRLGALLAPQVPLLMAYWAGLPALVFGLASLLSGALALFVPETANAALPDTLQQAEALGKRRRTDSVKDENS